MVARRLARGIWWMCAGILYSLIFICECIEEALTCWGQPVRISSLALEVALGQGNGNSTIDGSLSILGRSALSVSDAADLVVLTRTGPCRLEFVAAPFRSVRMVPACPSPSIFTQQVVPYWTYSSEAILRRGHLQETIPLLQVRYTV